MSDPLFSFPLPEPPPVPEVLPENIRLSTLQERWNSSTSLTLAEMAALQHANAQPATEPDPMEVWADFLNSTR